MSVIYEALKKIEQKNNKDKTPSSKNNFVIIVVIGLFSLGISSAYFTLKPSTKQTKAPVVIENEGIYFPKKRSKIKKVFSLQKGLSKSKKSHGQFLLHGLIYDEEESIALINGKKVKMGEAIEGARLLNISRNGVELETKDGKVYIPLEF